MTTSAQFFSKPVQSLFLRWLRQACSHLEPARDCASTKASGRTVACCHWRFISRRVACCSILSVSLSASANQSANCGWVIRPWICTESSAMACERASAPPLGMTAAWSQPTMDDK
ncbi:Uncharacterised protein [Vibrio cholerae]|nr:Uncharacterised protein [Vibrio cholerae]